MDFGWFTTNIRLVAFSLISNLTQTETMIQFSEVGSEQSCLDLNVKHIVLTHPNQPPLDLATHVGLLHPPTIAANFLRSLRTSRCSAKKC